MDRIAAAIAQTRARPDSAVLARVLIELEDVAARLASGEPLTSEYRRTLFFDAVATRELDDTADSDLNYLNLLSEIASAIDGFEPAAD